MNFLDEFLKNTQISNFIKIFSVGAELFYANRQIDRRTGGEVDREDKVTGHFSKFSECAKKGTET
jgi:hypothetical protein